MARKEKISEERKKLIQEFIKSNDLKTAGDIQEAIKELFKDTIQEMLNAELTEHLGYEKNEYTEDNENYRNGYSQKTVHSTEGDITLNVPRDRQGTFDPIVVEKGQKDISSIEEKIIKMYARGFSNQNIYVCNIVECDEYGKLVFENLKDFQTQISIADITFDEYFGTNDTMIRLHLEE